MSWRKLPHGDVWIFSVRLVQSLYNCNWGNWAKTAAVVIDTLYKLFCVYIKNERQNDYTKNNRGPSYIRLTGVPGYPLVYEKDYDYKFGEPVTLKNGKGW